MVLTRLLDALMQCTSLYLLPQLWLHDNLVSVFHSSLRLLSEVLVTHRGRCSTSEFARSSLNCWLAWTSLLFGKMDGSPASSPEDVLIAKGIGKD